MSINQVKDFLVGATGIATNVGVAISLQDVSQIVTIITSVLIALTTCGIQIYRMIRDRDDDKKGKEDNDNK